VTAAPPRLVVIDDHQLFAETLQFVLAREGYDALVVEPPPEPDALDRVLDAALAFTPTIALVDLNLGPAGPAVPLVAALVEAGVRVVVVTSAERSEWGESLQLGASVVISKTVPLQEILARIQALLAGEEPMPAAERDQLLREWETQLLRRAELLVRFDALSARENEILHDLMNGRTVRDIAHESVVSMATVRTQIRAILHKLEVSSQLAAVVLATRAGWRPDR
jgi:two-component system, NarL family, nitrate/nitrite response regulator NarL